MIITRIASVAGALILTACAAQTTERASKQKHTAEQETVLLAGSEWTTDIKGQFIRFGADGKVSGNGGCNRFGGSFEEDGSLLTFGPLMSTKMACEVLDSEQIFFGILAKTKRAEITHLTLTLKNESGDVLLSLARHDWD